MQSQDLSFTFHLDPRLVSMALRTITHNHENLQRISVRPEWLLCDYGLMHADTADLGLAIGEAAYAKWLELDHILAGFWESHSIRSRVLYNIPSWMGWESAKARMEVFLPEITARGIADFIGCEISRLI